MSHDSIFEYLKQLQIGCGFVALSSCGGISFFFILHYKIKPEVGISSAHGKEKNGCRL